MQRGGLGPAIMGFDANQNVFMGELGILDKDIEVAVFVEDARVEKFVFRLLAAAATVLFHKLGVGKHPLRILVEEFHIGVRGRRIEIEIALFDVFAVVALVVVQAKKALFENRVPAVP
jgi:hypothetical protein